MKPINALTACWLFSMAVFMRPVLADEPLGDVARIAGPIEFRVALTDVSTLAFSWNDTLLNGAPVDRFYVYESGSRIATVTDNSWILQDISRDAMYSFSVSAVTAAGEETRHSNSVSIDLPPLPGDTDGGNAMLPPLTKFQAEIVSETTATLSWDAGEAFWIPEATEPLVFEYLLWIESSLVASTNDTQLTYDELPANAATWVGMTTSYSADNYSRQPDFVLVDTREPSGTLSQGMPGYSAIENLEALVYSPSSGEVFWGNTGGSGPTAYNVFVNGVLVARTEGTSQYLGTLPSGTRSRISVGETSTYGDTGHDELLTHIWLETPGGDAESPQYPISVTGLRAEVYSPTATELFWDRSRATAARYRIYVDSTLMAETDGTSWFYDGYTPREVHVATVAALDANDVEIDSTQIQFYNPSASGDDDRCQVYNLRALTYSSTAAEVFWDRDPRGPAYQLLLDGQELQITTAISWFFENLEAGSEHEVKIFVDSSDCESVVKTVRFDLPD